MQEVSPRMHMASLVSATILRLLLAAFLGGIIGLERELKHKPAGLRTNMFICFGSAMFTILSVELAGSFTGDHTRIAAQIIPGIGFIGAGSILHSRGSVTGLTTAATLFVVASVGMAVGGGLYLPAIFATMVIFLALEVLGRFENRFLMKAVPAGFQVMGKSGEELLTATTRVLDRVERSMERVTLSKTAEFARLQFFTEVSKKEQNDIIRRLQLEPGVTSAAALGADRDAE